MDVIKIKDTTLTSTELQLEILKELKSINETLKDIIRFKSM